MSAKVSKKAVEVADEQLGDYELVLVFSPAVAEEATQAAIGRISQFITERGGTSATVEQWGKKRLAYPIKHFIEGSYVLARFRLKPKLVRELEANLRISEEVLRHLLLKIS